MSRPILRGEVCLVLGLLLACAAPLAAAPGWRIRADHEAPLNADRGWAAGLNEEAVVFADRPFRLRIELERGVSLPGTTGIILQYRRNDEEDWIEVLAHDFPYPEAEEPQSPRVSVVSSRGFVHGEPTNDVLTGSAHPFAGGSGVNLAGQAPAWTTRDGHLEIEFALVVRRWVDGAGTNEAGDRFELRLADGRGRALPGAGVATVRLALAPGHVGGTFVETPGRIGPWRARNGDLYFVMEPAESSNLFMMVKSGDGGRSWREVDGAHRPRTDDLESVDGRLVGDTIHLVHQVTEFAVLHTFRTSDHPTAPDSWARTDEPVATVESIAQAASLAVRGDGTFVAFLVGPTLQFAQRASDGKWSEPRPVDPAETRVLAGPQAVVGADDTVHLAYWRDDGTIWYRRMARDGTLSSAVQLAGGAGTTRQDLVAVLPLVHLPRSDTVVVVYRLADGHLWERRIGADGVPAAARRVTDRTVVNHAADSQQPGADVVGDDDSVQVLFIDAETRELRHTHDRGGWQPSRAVVTGIRADWVRGDLHRGADGAAVYRFVYDAGSGGGAGMNRYGEVGAR
jgi:hypothetical protein